MNAIQRFLSFLFPYNRPSLFHKALALHIRDADASGKSALR